MRVSVPAVRPVPTPVDAAATKGERTRERLLDIAEAAVQRYGFAGVSIDAVAAAGGISKSGFYFHFASKNAMAGALLHRAFERLERALRQSHAETARREHDPLERLCGGLDRFADVLTTDERALSARLLAAGAFRDSQFDRVVRQIAEERLGRIDALFRARLTEVAQAYALPSPQAVGQLASLLVGVLEGAPVVAVVRRDASLIATHVRLIGDLLRRAGRQLPRRAAAAA